MFLKRKLLHRESSFLCVYTEVWPFVYLCIILNDFLLFTGIEGISLPAGQAPDYAQR